MKQSRVRTLDGIAKALSDDGFKKYAKDYGNSRVNVEGSLTDAINTLESYQDDEKLITHFNYFRREMSEKYSSGQPPFYKTDAFKEQNQNEINEFGYIVSM